MNETRPLYRSAAPHGGPSFPDTVDLTCGCLEHVPDADINAYNQFASEDLEFTRIYTTALALKGLHEIGMAVGWRHMFSFSGASTDSLKWAPIRFEDPKGATEEFVPNLVDGKPTGEFPLHPGTPFLLKGVPSSTVGKWDSFTWQRNGLEKWEFLPTPSKLPTYRLSRMVEPSGLGTSFNYDDAHGGRLSTICDNAGKVLLTFFYGDDGLMSSISSSKNTEVYFTYQSQAGAKCLYIVSPRVAKGEPHNGIYWKYGYQATRRAPFLATVETLSPTPNGLSKHKNVYDLVTGKEIAFWDAVGNHAEFTYEDGRTRTTLFSPPGGS